MTTTSPIQPLRVWLRRGSLQAPEERSGGFTAAVPIQRHDILRERQLLLQLAADLESDDDVNPKGIALVERLLVDSASPVYVGGPEDALHRALVHAHAALYLA